MQIWKSKTIPHDGFRALTQNLGSLPMGIPGTELGSHPCSISQLQQGWEDIPVLFLLQKPASPVRGLVRAHPQIPPSRAWIQPGKEPGMNEVRHMPSLKGGGAQCLHCLHDAEVERGGRPCRCSKGLKQPGRAGGQKLLCLLFGSAYLEVCGAVFV